MAAKSLSPAPEIDCGDVQGIILRGYGRLPHARYLLLRFGDAVDARRWLGDLVPRLTPARATAEALARNLGFTLRGLDRLGLPRTAQAGFAPAFVQGIAGDRPDGRSHRSRILGDVPPAAPDSWTWGGPRDPIDALLLLYARDEPAMAGLLAAERALLAHARIEATELEGRELAGRKEHFGFRDGISQPALRNANRIDDRPGLLAPDRPENTVEAGEFLLGHLDAYGQRSEGPLLEPATDPERLLPLLDPEHEPISHWGHDGSYLVFRQLRQHVQAFWRCMERLARETAGDVAGEIAGKIEPDARSLAARLVGRWPSGAPLVLSPEADDDRLADRNDFAYAARDPDALLCPAGSHVRRANPRDWTLSSTPEHALVVANRHRLIRRGRPYGAPVDPLLDPEKMRVAPQDDEPRGLQFLCFNASLERQYEMVQGSWLDQPKFAGLRDERDPLLGTRPGGGGRFSLPGSPVSKRLAGLPRFVDTVGGAYFFVPGLAALRWLVRNAEASAQR